ncbi:protease inhibitor I42 family protein [Crenobacter caeni]|uniref:Protease inhibitor I42 family protein n=1 Tax=Crenobacter caeni TaxID=2705474 RepID=A0A6B2KVC1_9NEIS|nr:protease inhibitor I42 family protein [Crenobacter caeni]NDV13990.1 protease inhibitor I42 family protein [Crenobacter caeni]
MKYRMMIAALLLAGCASAPPARDDATAQVPNAGVVLTEADNGLAVTLVRSQALLVELPAQPGTGYGWSWQMRGAALLEADGEPVFLPEKPGLAGGRGLEQWTLRARARGQGVLVFEYRRPWEGGAPLRELAYPVRVD